MNTIIENIDIETGGQSATATVCENAQLFGATPERDEFDSREVWDADEATGAVCEAFRIIAEGACPDGLQLADERESLLWGFVNMLDAQTQRLDRAADKLGPELRDLQREQDGTEIKSFELELLTDRVRNLGDRRDAFETMRDAAAENYRAVTGNTWRPRRGSHTSQTGQLTSAAIDARDYQRARKDRKTQAHPAPGHPGRHRRRQGHRRPGGGDRPARQGPREVRRHGAGPRRRSRRREDRGKLGGAQRHRPGRLQA